MEKETTRPKAQDALPAVVEDGAFVVVRIADGTLTIAPQTRPVAVKGNEFIARLSKQKSNQRPMTD